MVLQHISLAPLVTTLGLHSPLDAADREALMALPVTIRTMEALGYIAREGDVPTSCSVLLAGYAFRQKLTSEGTRQILSLHLPGDPIDFQTLFLSTADHNLQALTQVRIAAIPRKAIVELMDERPAVAHAVIANMLVEASIGREWQLNVGRRDARSRLAHFLCEFGQRVDASILADSGRYELPMTQEQLGDALGLTSVHVNRTLKALEAEGVLHRAGRKIVFPAWQRLRSIAGFSPHYLHFGDQAA